MEILFAISVSTLGVQVAEFMEKNKKLSYCKIVEVAETTAPLLPMEELLAKIKSKQEPPAETLKELAPSGAEPKPTKSIVKDEPTNVQEQKITPLSPYAM